MQLLNHYSALQLRDLIARREVSVVEVVEAHLREIERTGEINAVVALDAERALAQAKQFDQQQPDPARALYGLPVAIKDTYDAKGLPTTLGSIRRTDHIATKDALHVGRMREAGAIVLGKTNIPEYAAGSHSVNRVYGATKNPYDLGRSAGGSSGGAAAALAARQVALADGSDMGGSLRNPASFCNVVGFRPSPGVVPSAGDPNLLTPLTTAGPMGRTVADVELLLSVIGKRDPLTPTGAPESLALMSEGSLAGLRVAYAPSLGGRIPVDPEVVAVLDTVVDRLRDAGAMVSEACPNLDNAAETFLTLRSAEFDAELGDTLDADPEDFNDRLTWNIMNGRNLSGRDVMSAQMEQSRIMRDTARFFTEYDLLLSPVAQVPPFPGEWEYPTEINGQHLHNYLEWMSAAIIVTMMGVPAISVPGGFTQSGLPVGAQFSSAYGNDAKLLSWARAFEAQTRYADRLPLFNS